MTQQNGAVSKLCGTNCSGAPSVARNPNFTLVHLVYVYNSIRINNKPYMPFLAVIWLRGRHFENKRTAVLPRAVQFPLWHTAFTSTFSSINFTRTL